MPLTKFKNSASVFCFARSRRYSSASKGVDQMCHTVVLPNVVSPPIGQIHSFDDAIDAFRSLDDRTATAKVLFEVAGE